MFKQFVSVLGVFLLAGSSLSAQPAAQQQRPGPIPSIDDRTSGMKKIDGYFPLYWDERTGSMFLEISRFDSDFLFSTGLSAGLGSNDIGLDRGQGGGGRLVRFQRVGPRVMLVQPNQSFRSSSKNPLEVKSVEDSFAKSILWGFTVAAESGGNVLVDATDFLLRDVTNAAGRLRPGNYRVDRTRSAFFLPNTRNFPKNTEIDMTLTFVNEATGGGGGGGGGGPAQGPAPIGATGGGGGGGGGFGGNLFSGTVASVTPTPDAVTMREHVSFVELPDGNYKPRVDDPRAGYGGLTFVDYSVPIGEPIQFRYIRRHRLQKKDPAAAMSEPIKPIQVPGGLGRAGGREEGAARRRRLVEPGVRGRGLPQRVQGGRAARGGRPDGHPLQHDQLGASLDARLELRRLGVRSAHRRDHQGHGHARIAPRSPGLHDLRGPDLALRQRQREADAPVRGRAQAHPPARRARGGPHSRPRPQLLRQQQGLDFGDGLPAPARGAEGRRHDRHLQRLSAAHRRLGQGRDQLRLSRIHRRAPAKTARSTRSSTRRGRKTCATSPTRTPTSTRASSSGRTAPTRPTS